MCALSRSLCRPMARIRSGASATCRGSAVLPEVLQLRAVARKGGQADNRVVLERTLLETHVKCTWKPGSIEGSLSTTFNLSLAHILPECAVLVTVAMASFSGPMAQPALFLDPRPLTLPVKISLSGVLDIGDDGGGEPKTYTPSGDFGTSHRRSHGVASSTDLQDVGHTQKVETFAGEVADVD